MKLLIITQSVDKNNTVLGFMHRWIEEFSKKFESIVVICLEKGEYSLPKNVKVLSLGKEEGRTRLKYIFRFYRYIWAERKNYDAVFVHMNQEYVLLGWKAWWLLRKPVYMWRNHPAGSLLTDIAAFFCKKVFCTSKYSYTAKYKKTVIMPVGIDTEIFKPTSGITRESASILFLGRITPIKGPDLLVDALFEIKDKDWNTEIVGDALPKDEGFLQKLKDKVHSYGLEKRVAFLKGVPNQDTPAIYSAHEIFVNLSPSGMYDKTIFEAIACGCLVLTSNKNLEGQITGDFLFEKGDVLGLSQRIAALIHSSQNQKNVWQNELRNYVVENHSLQLLLSRMKKEIDK